MKVNLLAGLGVTLLVGGLFMFSRALGFVAAGVCFLVTAVLVELADGNTVKPEDQHLSTRRDDDGEDDER